MLHKPFALVVNGVHVHYHHMPVLWDISLQIPQAHIVGILGPNGAGKSTFMKVILDLIPKVSGDIQILGHKVRDVRKKIAYVPQQEAIDWDFPITVKELVLMGAYPQLGLFRFVTKKHRSQAQECLDMVGMGQFASRQINQLSGGQKQRAFLARALMQQAEVYFLDEPLSGVDHASEEIIIDLLRGLKKEKKTIFMIHHDLNSVEKYFDMIILLNVRLIACGQTKEIFTRENISQAYGKSLSLFDEAYRLRQTKAIGEA